MLNYNKRITDCLTINTKFTSWLASDQRSGYELSN